jgi:hypothetical protein
MGMNENGKLNGNTITPTDSFSRLKESQNKLLSELDAMRSRQNVKTSNAKMISILH